MTNLTTREPAEPVTNWWLWYTYPPWKIWVRLENIINKLLGTIKFMFQTTNQITIIFPLLLVYSLLTTINITINHHIPKHRVNHHQPGKFLTHIMMTYLPDPRRIEPRQNPLHKPFATYLSTAYFKRMFSGKNKHWFQIRFWPNLPYHVQYLHVKLARFQGGILHLMAYYPMLENSKILLLKHQNSTTLT